MGLDPLKLVVMVPVHTYCTVICGRAHADKYNNNCYLCSHNILLLLLLLVTMRSTLICIL